MCINLIQFVPKYRLFTFPTSLIVIYTVNFKIRGLYAIFHQRLYAIFHQRNIVYFMCGITESRPPRIYRELVDLFASRH